jgi:hypothetical protein
MSRCESAREHKRHTIFHGGTRASRTVSYREKAKTLEMLTPFSRGAILKTPFQ